MSVNPICVAVDTADLARAEVLVEQVREAVGCVKLGLEFFCANGPAGVARIGLRGLPVFLDLKLHDIPNTVAKAAGALEPLSPSILTVHAAGGPEMMKAAKAAAPPGTRVVAVTVLTSLSAADLRAIGVGGDPAEQVAELAMLARTSGLDGIVCSGEEVTALRQDWPEGFFVVPGLRPHGAPAADQKRVVTPAEALHRGASILVVGRPITAAADPGEAARAILASL